MIPPWILGATGAAVALSVIVLAACRSSDGGADNLPGSAPDGVSQDVLVLEELGGGAVSGVMEPGLHVLRDQAAFDALWRQHTRLQLPTPPTPAVDFDHSMVVATFVGQKATGGYSVTIEEVLRMPETASRASQIVVRTRETVPAPDAVMAQMTTAPFHMVRVPRANGDAVLVND